MALMETCYLLLQTVGVRVFARLSVYISSSLYSFYNVCTSNDINLSNKIFHPEYDSYKSDYSFLPFA